MDQDQQLGVGWARLHRAVAARRRIVVSLAIALGAVVLAVAVGSRSPRLRTPLASQAEHTQAEIRAMQTKLRTAGLKEAAVEQGVLYAPADEADRYRAALGETASSSQSPQWSEVWNGASERLGRFASSREREAAGDIARAKVISDLLEQLPDVESAEIVWDETPSTGWRSPPTVRATVYLQPVAGHTIGPLAVDAVRRAVAGSKAHLAPADVVVMDQQRMVAYDGPAASRAQTRAAQLEAWHQSRIEAAVSHVPGARVTVFVEPPPETSVASTAHDDSHPLERQPVSVAISIPEESIRELAGLPPQGEEQESERRREVYRSVEGHLHRTLKSKAARLVPQGATEEGLARIVVDTIPAPRHVAAKSDAATPAAVAMLGMVAAHPLLAIAIATGVAALWMLLPFHRTSMRTAQPGSTAPTHTVPETIAEPAAAKASTLEPRVAQTTLPKRDAEQIADAANSSSRPVRAPIASPTVSQLDKALARLAQEGPRRSRRVTEPTPHTSTEANRQSAHVGEDPSPDQRNPSGRRDAAVPAVELPNGSSPEAAEPAEIEALAGADPGVLREVVSMLDAAVWARALYGASVVLQAQILPHLPPEAALDVERHLQGRRPLRLREIDEAQQQVLSAWSRVRQNLQQEFRTSTAAAGKSAESPVAY